MHSKYQQLIGLEDDNNNNGNVFNYNNTTLNGTPPKKRSPIKKLDAQLVGDGLFYTLAACDTTDIMLNQSEYFHAIDPNLTQNDWYQSILDVTITADIDVHPIGFCVSGQTIAVASKHIKMAHFFKASHLILNVGTIDILNCQSLTDMCIDFDRLIDVCEERGCTPIITTLAPLVSRNHSQEIHNKLIAFNLYLLTKYGVTHPFIDLWQQFTHRNGHTRLGFYET